MKIYLAYILVTISIISGCKPDNETTNLLYKIKKDAAQGINTNVYDIIRYLDIGDDTVISRNKKAKRIFTDSAIILYTYTDSIDYGDTIIAYHKYDTSFLTFDSNYQLFWYGKKREIPYYEVDTSYNFLIGPNSYLIIKYIFHQPCSDNYTYWSPRYGQIVITPNKCYGKNCGYTIIQNISNPSENEIIKKLQDHIISLPDFPK